MVIAARLGKGEFFAYKANQLLAERAIPALDMGGLTTFFADGLVRPSTKHLLIGVPAIAYAMACTGHTVKATELWENDYSHQIDVPLITQSTYKLHQGKIAEWTWTVSPVSSWRFMTLGIRPCEQVGYLEPAQSDRRRKGRHASRSPRLEAAHGNATTTLSCVSGTPVVDPGSRRICPRPGWRTLIPASVTASPM